VCARACARLSEHLVSVPAVTLGAWGGETEFIGPMLSVGGETGKRGDEWWGGGGEYECV
jgi:hypothetical protein